MTTPEENYGERGFPLPSGHYRLVAAQSVTGEDKESVALFFEPLTTELECSTILVADVELNPSPPLLETAEIAGEY